MEYLDNILEDLKNKSKFDNISFTSYCETLDFLKEINHWSYIRLMEAICEKYKLILLNIYDYKVFKYLEGFISIISIMYYEKYNNLDVDGIIDYINSL